ncbi:MAG TPA: HlyD family efflux transporter periplasmic adaptor subunit [Spirochaetia bacterium]|nr:HlyD family efflux transporter periplasmic adaptor subunit [Spirochaetia bacterium]
MSRKTIIILVVAIAVVVLAGIIGYYWYEGYRYVSTDDARVAANVVSVNPEIAGKILEWRVKEGDVVQKDDVLGRQDLGAALTSGALNPQSLGAVAGVAAEKAVLRAPIAGQVILSTAVVGEMATPGMSLAVIADTDGLYISANIKEGDIARVKTGLPVDFWVDAFHGRLFHGRVETIGRATSSTFSLLPAQNGGGNYTKVIQVIPIKVSILDAGNARLMIGMNSYIKIHVN